MFQPLPKFQVPLIDYILKIKCRYMVTQLYPRGKNMFMPENIVSLIATHYIDKGRAIDHLKALKGDLHSNIYDLEDEEGKLKFVKLLENKQDYVVYTAITDKKRIIQNLNNHYKDHMRKYLEKHTNWKIGGKDEIVPGLLIILGELFVTLSYSSFDKLQIPILDIENA